MSVDFHSYLRRATKLAVCLLSTLLLIMAAGGCAWLRRPARKTAQAPAKIEPLAPSPRLIVGRILSVDSGRQFAFVELGSDAPAPQLTDGTELIARSSDLRETARLRASRYLRGRTLGTTVLSGQPTPGDEVVWLAP